MKVIGVAGVIIGSRRCDGAAEDRHTLIGAFELGSVAVGSARTMFKEYGGGK